MKNFRKLKRLQIKLVRAEAKLIKIENFIKSLETFPGHLLDDTIELFAEIAVLKFKIKGEE